MQSPRIRRQTLDRESLAGYEIVARIKTGGMAALYLGRKTGAGGFAKYVAIKVILDHMAEDPTLVAMFLDEARLSARIEHPNVVHIHELGEQDEKHFLVMEYVAGCSLAQLQRAITKRSRRLTPAIAAYLGMQVAAGLHAAHETTGDDGECLHVVHRDVSPKNILIAYKGYVKLIDFGIAKVRDASQSTSAGSLKGTIRYMSPEQASGRPVDRRSDVFSLGIVLWELLTGRALFHAENELGALDMVRSAAVPPPSQFAPVPPALEQVVMTMLQRSPDARYATADDVHRALAMAVPEALGVSPQKLGELLAAVLPAPPERDLDPSIVSALGRPLPIGDPEHVLDRLAAPVDEIELEPIEASSGVSARGAVAVTPIPQTSARASSPGRVSSPGDIASGRVSTPGLPLIPAPVSSPGLASSPAVASIPGLASSPGAPPGRPSPWSEAQPPSAQTPIPLDRQAEVAPARPRAWPWAAAIALVLVVVIGVAAAWALGRPADTMVSTALPTTPSVASPPVVAPPEAAPVAADPATIGAPAEPAEPAVAGEPLAEPSRTADPEAGARRPRTLRPGQRDAEETAPAVAPAVLQAAEPREEPGPEARPEPRPEPRSRRRRADTHVTGAPVISTEF